MTDPTKKRILVVDDDPFIRRVVGQSLSLSGYDVIVVETGQKGIDAARSEHPDLILLDVMLPGMDGYQICQSLRADPQTTSVPIIMLTALDEPEAVVKGLQAGADDYLTKPFSADELAMRLSAHLRRTEREVGMNPLTKLPGNPEIEQEIQKRLDQHKPLAVLYIDLTNFKAYNDKYGWLRGDRIILMLARQILIAAREFGSPDDFVGHVGGDDFIAVSMPDSAERVAQQIIKAFDRTVAGFYPTEDWERGYISAIDRRGKPFRAPMVTVAIAIVTNQLRSFQHVEQVAAQAALVKEYVKSLPGSRYSFDRRSK